MVSPRFARVFLLSLSLGKFASCDENFFNPTVRLWHPPGEIVDEFRAKSFHDRSEIDI